MCTTRCESRPNSSRGNRLSQPMEGTPELEFARRRLARHAPQIRAGRADFAGAMLVNGCNHRSRGTTVAHHTARFPPGVDRHPVLASKPLGDADEVPPSPRSELELPRDVRTSASNEFDRNTVPFEIRFHRAQLAVWTLRFPATPHSRAAT